MTKPWIPPQLMKETRQQFIYFGVIEFTSMWWMIVYFNGMVWWVSFQQPFLEKPRMVVFTGFFLAANSQDLNVQGPNQPEPNTFWSNTAGWKWMGAQQIATFYVLLPCFWKGNCFNPAVGSSHFLPNQQHATGNNFYRASKGDGWTNSAKNRSLKDSKILIRCNCCQIPWFD